MASELHKACAQGDVPLVASLLNRFHRIDRKDRQGCVPLHVAASRGHIAVVEMLLDRGADVDALDAVNRAAISHACLQGRLDVVQLLLDRNAAFDVVDINGRTPLNHACDIDAIDIVHELLERGASVNGVEIPDDPEESKDDEYHWLEVRSIGPRIWPPLHDACRAGKLRAVRTLLEHNALVRSIDHEGMTAFMRALQYSNLHLLQELLAQDRTMIDDIAPDGTTALYRACVDGMRDQIELLISLRADVNKPMTNTPQHTPLHASVVCERAEAVHLLVEAGANTLARNRIQRTPKDIARTKTSLEYARLLDAGWSWSIEKARMGLVPQVFAAMVTTVTSIRELEATSILRMLPNELLFLIFSMVPLESFYDS